MFTTLHVPLMRNSAKNVKQLIIRSFYSCLKSYTMHHIEAHLMSTIDCVNYATFLPITISQKGFNDVIDRTSMVWYHYGINVIMVSRSNCQVLLGYRWLCVSYLCWYRRLRFPYIDRTHRMINEIRWISFLVGSHDAEE